MRTNEKSPENNIEDFLGKIFLLRNGMVVTPRQHSSSRVIDGCEVTIIRDSSDHLYENGGFRVNGKIKYEINVTFDELTLGEELQIPAEPV